MTHSEDTDRVVSAAIGRHIAVTSVEKIRKSAAPLDRARILREAILDLTRNTLDCEAAVHAFAMHFTIRVLRGSLRKPSGE